MNKKILILATLIGILIASVVGATIFVRNSSSQQTANTSNDAGEENTIRPDDQTKKKSNPFIFPEDLKTVDDAYKKQYEEQGITEPTQAPYDFRYELDPGLNDPQSFNIFRPAYAATRCNLDPLPQTLPVYLLKTHLNTGEASLIASKFSIASQPSSLPSDGGTFQYFFTDDYSTGFLSVYESSGSYTYHKVPGNLGVALPTATIKDNVQSLIQTYGFNNMAFESELLGPEVNAYRYRKKWGQYKVTDKIAIQSIGNLPLCDIEDAYGMNYLEIHMRIDGTLSRFINQTRDSLKTVDMIAIPFAQAFKQQNRTFIDPIVVPENSATDGKVIIDEVTLVYYDFGNLYPQQAYIPTYLTRGSIPGTSTVVYSFIPAVDENSLVQAGLLSLASEGYLGDTSQKQTTFYYIGAIKQSPPPISPPKPKSTIRPTTFVLSLTPTETPEPTPTPEPTDPLRSPTPTRTPSPTRTPTPTRAPTPTSVLDACPKFAVDYNARCTKGGNLLCIQSTIVEKSVTLQAASSMQPNPANVCSSGCVSISKSFSNTAGQDPCKKVLDDAKVPIKNYQDFKKGVGYPAGTVSCTIDVCPC